MSFKNYWGSLTPEKKKRLAFLGLVGAIFILGAIAYQFRTPERKVEKVAKVKQLSMDQDILKKSLYEENRREITKRDDKLTELQARLAELEKEQTVQSPAENSDFVKPPRGGNRQVSVLPAEPPPPLTTQAPGGTYYPQDTRSSFAPPPPPAAEQVIEYGDIAVTSGSSSTNIAGTNSDKKKDKKSVYLPPSFMAATLLSGLDAPTMEGSKGNPIPVLIRVKDLAILPNSVKADLKGCFVIAEGFGDLSTERANLRLVSLSCLSRKGESVIDQKVKGFIVDQDGKIGLRGKVVAKMGSMIARAALAGFASGVGDAVSQSYTVQSTSALGTTSSVSSSDIAQYGAATGAASALKEVSKFYLDLAKQTMPVIEIGATRNITIVIEEGTSLDIRDQGDSK